MGYYSAFNRIDSSIIGHGTVNRKNVMLSERSRPQKTTNHMIAFTMRCPDQAKSLRQEAERYCQGQEEGWGVPGRRRIVVWMMSSGGWRRQFKASRF